MCFWNYLGWKAHTSFNSLDFKVRYILDNLIFGGKNATLCTWSQWNKVNMMNESCEKMAAETDRGIPVGGFCLKWRFTALTGFVYRYMVLWAFPMYLLLKVLRLWKWLHNRLWKVSEAWQIVLWHVMILRTNLASSRCFGV